MESKGSILVVEDDAIIQEALSQILEGGGYIHTGAMSRAEALEKFEVGRFACALIDLGLPDGSGIDLLPEFQAADSQLVNIILTGDNRSDTIVETMRAGAFDYLTKPLEATQLLAAVARAKEHHDAIRERDNLVRLLSEEREQLKQRVEEATVDIRQYADHCETISARLQSLLRLTQMSAEFFTDQALFQAVFEELGKFVPLRCVALCGADTYEFLAALPGEDDEVRIIVAETLAQDVKIEGTPGRHELLGIVFEAMAYHTDFDARACTSFDYPQSFWGRTVGTVVFFTDQGIEPDEHLMAFLSMCAHFIAYERQESRLFLHATKQASLGNIAFELSKGLIQGLTAIGTISDYIVETKASPEVVEGLEIIRRNVSSMQHQVQNFRQLSTLRRDAIETVHLDVMIDQALDMLTMAIESRKIRVIKDYRTDLECVLLNGSTLARTFLDLISSAVRTAEASGQVVLRLTDTDNSFISFEISHDGQYADVFNVVRAAREQSVPELIEGTPSFLLAQRTIQSCGGRLLFEQEKGACCGFRLLLPRNATGPGRVPDAAERS